MLSEEEAKKRKRKKDLEAMTPFERDMDFLKRSFAPASIIHQYKKEYNEKKKKEKDGC